MAESDADGAGQALGRVTVEADIGHARPEPVPQAVAQCQYPFGFDAHVARADLHGLAEAHDARHVLGARAAPPLVLAAVLDGDHLGSAANVERRHALGPVDLVRGARQKVDPPALEINGNLAERLDGVHVEGDAVGARDGPDGGNGLDRPHLAVGVHHADGEGVGPEGALDVIGIDHAVFVHRQIRHGDAESLQGLGRAQHGVMLDPGGDEVARPLGRHQALHGEVVGFRSAGGEDDLLGPRPQETRHPLAGGVESLPGLPPETVNAGGVAEVFSEVRKHLRHDLGMHGRRRVVIQVHSTAHRLALLHPRC